MLAGMDSYKCCFISLEGIEQKCRKFWKKGRRWSRLLTSNSWVCTYRRTWAGEWTQATSSNNKNSEAQQTPSSSAKELLLLHNRECANIRLHCLVLQLHRGRQEGGAAHYKDGPVDSPAWRTLTLYISSGGQKKNIKNDPKHPGHHLFSTLPSGRLRAIRIRSNGLKNSFFPRAVDGLSHS